MVILLVIMLNNFFLVFSLYSISQKANLELLAVNKKSSPIPMRHQRNNSMGSLPESLEKQETKFNGMPDLLADQPDVRHKSISAAFYKTNTELANRSFDVAFSGSTCVTVMLFGDRLTCANVGDSRAVMASYKDPKQLSGLQLPKEFLATLKPDEKIWLALPLSRDHKPDDEDEYKRIVSKNGRVEPFREPNGEPVGPPRVWLMNENIPGLAMSRSFGDLVAAQAGVITVPEIYDTKVTQDDKFILIASDGVWEFIPNDEAVEMVVPFWKANDPEGACDKLMQEAVKRWEKEDEVIDDITLIVAFLGHS